MMNLANNAVVCDSTGNCILGDYLGVTDMIAKSVGIEKQKIADEVAKAIGTESEKVTKAFNKADDIASHFANETKSIAEKIFREIKE